MQAPLLENEPARLKALHDYGILDTAAESEFDDFTLLAAQICGTPVALISLIDADRQWFKSNIGLDATETPRDQAFCTHALHQSDVFLVPNAAADDRFADNPLVTGDQKIRFYAGAPLVTEEGHALGTLCVIDRVPRTLTSEQQAALQALSRQVIARLELRRQLAEREQTQDALRRVQEELETRVAQRTQALAQMQRQNESLLNSAGEGIYGIDPQGVTQFVNPAGAKMLGYEIAELVGQPMHALLHHSHSDGTLYPAHACPIYRSLRDGSVYHVDSEVFWRKDGTSFDVEYLVNPLREGDRFTGAVVTFQNVSKRKRMEEALLQRTEELSAALQEHHNVMETVPDILFRLDMGGRLVQWNRKLELVTGLPPESLRGKSALDLFAEDEKNVIAQAIAQAFRDGYVAVEGSLLGTSGAAVLHQFSGVPLRNTAGEATGLTGMGRDITERRRSEMDLLESETRYRGLVDHSPEAVIVYSEDRFVYANAAAVTLFAASRGKELIGRMIFDVVHPDYHTLARKRAAQSQQEGKTSPLTEQKYVRLNGEVIDVEAVSTGIIYQGKPAGQVLIRDITERKKAQKSILALNSELVHAYDATIEGWSRALDLRDHETEGHSRRVTEMTMLLAQAVGIPEAQMIHVRRGALLHDIGKMGVPDRILLKPGPLDDDEWAIMRRHPTLAQEMLSPTKFLHPALDIPYCHHEKWDGTGYPQGLRGTEIPLAARLFALVDVWDALTSNRPYRPAWPRERVLDHLRSLAGTHFDPEIVSVFLSLADLETAAEASLSKPVSPRLLAA